MTGIANGVAHVSFPGGGIFVPAGKMNSQGQERMAVKSQSFPTPGTGGQCTR